MNKLIPLLLLLAMTACTNVVVNTGEDAKVKGRAISMIDDAALDTTPVPAVKVEDPKEKPVAEPVAE